MSKDILNGQVDFLLLVEVNDANPSGNPLNENVPRTTYDGRGEITDVCIKRKIRNRFMQMGLNVFVQSDDKKLDEYMSLSERYFGMTNPDKTLTKDQRYAEACDLWDDVRLFGSLFAYKKDKAAKGDGVSLGVTGAATIQVAKSVAPVDIISDQITKSVNSESTDGKKSSDTMGMKHRVAHGLYVIKGSISPIQAHKNGVTESDVEHLKEALSTLFVGDESAARPAGSMRVVRLYWFRHDGCGSAYNTHHSVKISVKPDVDVPTSFDDYDVEYTPVPGVHCDIIDF